jgi:lipopolysaccharide/colanic/teichoic acid biosynthesis glycosyltransferase
MTRGAGTSDDGSSAFGAGQSPQSSHRTTRSDLVIDLRGVGWVEIDLTGAGAPLLGADEGLLGASLVEARLKRVIDVVVAAAAVVVLSPVFLVIAISIKLTSRGPIFYRQVRVAEKGRKFRFLKFRTMQVNAEHLRRQLEDRNESDGPVFKIRNDPRVTKVGRLLRKSSFDELPQLFHVISGRMSLVGPRPPLPEEVETYSWRELQRLLVKPGITCIWQVSGRSDLDFETWVQMDLEYIRTWSPQADLRLLAKTVPAVLSGRGAY